MTSSYRQSLPEVHLEIKLGIMDGRPIKHEVMLGAATVLAQLSTCARRKVGCILTDVNGRILSTGNNGVAKGLPHCIDHPCAGASCPSGTGLELCEAIHAEQNALMFCADVMKIHHCYVTCSPCVHCVKMLLNTACREIHFMERYPSNAWELWLSDKTAGRSWCHHGDD